MATIEVCETSTQYEQLIPIKSRLKYNELRNCGLNVNNDFLLDVEFSFNDGQSKLRAHKLILLDCPPSEFFSEKLTKNVGLVVINVPNGINSASLDGILNFIYGKSLIELGVTNHDFDIEAFLNGANFFQMEITLLEQLVPILRVPNQSLQSYVSDQFQRLKTNEKFWNIENPVILQLCRALEPDVVEDGFLDWIHEHYAQRSDYFDKFMELRGLMISLCNNDEQDNNLVELEENHTIIHGNEHSDSQSIGTVVENESHLQNTGEAVPPKRKQRNQKRKFVRDSDTSESEHTMTPNPSPSKIMKRRYKRSKQSKMNTFFNNRLNEVRTILAEKKWSTKEFTETWTTIWEFMTLKSNKYQASKNEERFVDGNGTDLLLESRRAIQNEYSKYPTFSQTFLRIVYNFSGDPSVHLINSDEILTYLLEDLNNLWNFKEHDSTMVGQILAGILDSYDSEKWSLNISRELVATKLEETILKSWDLNSTGTSTMDYTQDLSGLVDLITLIESKDPTASLCGLWLMAYHTKSDTTNEIRNEKAMKCVGFLINTGLYTILHNCEKYGDCHAITYAKKLIKILDLGIDVIFNKQMDNIRSRLSQDSGKSKCGFSFTAAWVSVSHILLNSNFENKYEDKFLNEGGISLLIKTRNKLGNVYHNYPGFFQEFLEIIYLFSCRGFYVTFVCTEEIVDFILEDIIRYEKPKQSLRAGEIASYFLDFVDPDQWHSIFARRFVARRVKLAIISGRWDLNIDLFRLYDTLDDLLQMVKSNEMSVSLFGVWRLTNLTKSDTLNEEHNEKAKGYADWLKNTSLLEDLRNFVEQAEDAHLSNLAQQLCSNLL